MTYRFDEMQIIFISNQWSWQWILEDMQGDTRAHGSNRDYFDAAKDAFAAYAKALTP